MIANSSFANVYLMTDESSDRDFLTRLVAYAGVSPTEVATRAGLAVYYANRTIWGPGKGYANWIVCFNLNAKNALGGFVGFRPYALFIRNGVISNHGNGEYGEFTPITGDSDALKECSLGKEGKP